MRIFVDASVAIKWYFSENFNDEAEKLLATGYQLWAIDFMLIEVGNIIWKKRRRKELQPLNDKELFLNIETSLDRLLPVYPYLRDTMALSRQLDHSIYDCLYLAAGFSNVIPLVTADRRLYEKVAASPYAPLICWIENLPPVTAHGEK